MRFGNTPHEFCEDLNGAAPVQCLTWPVVEQISNGIERILVVHRQVGALGQHLAQQSVGVFTGSSLPRWQGVVLQP